MHSELDISIFLIIYINNKHNLKHWIYAIDIELTKLGIGEGGSEVN